MSPSEPKLEVWRVLRRARVARTLGAGVWIVSAAVLSCVSIDASGVRVMPSPIASQASASSRSQQNDEATKAPMAPPRGLEIVQHGGYPELRVDGAPFFIYSAAFFYDRIPRDMWEATLDRYRSLSINTLDLYIPWNWHEPKEGDLDFDGHSNPRRDLRTLLTLATQKGFKIIARPGPEILNEWRHGGYPGWLLQRPEYHMDPLDWIEGRYPPLDNLNTRDADAAARGWLTNATHMEATKSWFAAVAKELAPYSSHALVRVKSENPDRPPRDVGGPLLFVQLGDDFAIGRTNRVGADFWRYVEELRGMLVAGGLTVPVFINPTDMRVSASGSAESPPIGVMGQWYMQPRKPSGESEPPLAPATLTTQDAAEIEFFTEELKTQPDFPPVMIEYQAGWYAPADDDRPRPNLPQNTLLSSRLLIANGVHGFNYFPLQDTFTPAGYSVPWANPSYRWDAALSPSGDPQPRLAAVRRNSQLVEAWGPLLAASHKRADFGIIYPLGAYPQDLLGSPDIRTISDGMIRIERLAAMGLLSTELVDPQYQPVEQLLRDPMLLLPAFDPDKPQFQLSDKTQSRILEYVRRGGTLVVFPERPRGKTIDELWRDHPVPGAVSSESAIRAHWKFGEGEVIESSKDFYSWLSLDRSLAENKSQQESEWAIGVLREFMAAAQIRPVLKFSGKPNGANALFLSEIVTNEGTGLLGARTQGQGFLSATNLAEHGPVDADLRILSPSAPARGQGDGGYLPLHLIVPPRESVLLPLERPLCFSDPHNNPCGDSIPIAGAEFLNARRDGKTLELTFYIPARADLTIQLADRPYRVSLDEMDTKPDSTWVLESKELRLTIPRGVAPDFRRTLKLGVHYTPHVPEPDKHNQPSKAPPEDLEYYVQNAVRFPTSGSAFLRAYPALIVPDDNGKINVLLIAENHNQSVDGSLELSFDKPLHGYKNLSVPAHGSASEIIEFRTVEAQPSGTPPPPDHLFHAAIEVRAGHDHRVLPIAALLHAPGATEHYRFDFDRDGADEWVLENDRLRLIVSPESGGRALALVDKSSGISLASSVGLFRDNFSYTENPPGISEARARGKYGLFNRPYAASWTGDDKTPALHLQYGAADIYPAGANIEKTIQLDGQDAVSIEYRVGLRAKASDATASAPDHPQSFAIVNSFPLDASAGPGPASGSGAARFCWLKTPTTQSSPAGTSKSNPDDDENCVDFTPEGKPVVLPEGTSKVEIHSPGRAGIEMRWDCATTCGVMTIQPKLFSALFRLEFAALTPGADASHYSMRIRVLDAP